MCILCSKINCDVLIVARATLVVVLVLTSFACQSAAQTTDDNTQKTPVTIKPTPVKDISTDLLLLGADGGGGWSVGTSLSSVAYAGGKIGLPIRLLPGNREKGEFTVTLDLGYERVSNQNAFSKELSLMVPLWRSNSPKLDPTKKFLRVFIEPGIGHRGAGLNGYSSAKIMMTLLSDYKLRQGIAVPFIEFQRRFPFSAPLRGDNRIAIGVMVATCNHCD